MMGSDLIVIGGWRPSKVRTMVRAGGEPALDALGVSLCFRRHGRRCLIAYVWFEESHEVLFSIVLQDSIDVGRFSAQLIATLLGSGNSAKACRKRRATG
jgi:hypothetical protein